MKRDGGIDLYRCLCMLCIVCIHTFSMCDNPSPRLWALSCPSLVGFVLISSWFGIHFKWQKICRILGMVVFYTAVAIPFYGGRLFSILHSYWYVWAYLFVMLLSPIVDLFVEKCASRKELVNSFVSVAVLLWGWCFLSCIKPFSGLVPTVFGFGDCSAIVMLCVYVLGRLMKRVGWLDWFSRRVSLLLISFTSSACMVVLGFRHMHSVFAFIFAVSLLLLVRRIPLPGFLVRFFALVGPSMFGVYLLHFPFVDKFSAWEHIIYETVKYPHSVCQFLLALVIFVVAVAFDSLRRIAVVGLFAGIRRLQFHLIAQNV